METIFNNTIKHIPEEIQHHSFNNQNLLPHQNKLIKVLHDREKQLRAGESINGEVLFSKLGIIADPIHTGVLQTIVTYIKHTKSRPHTHTTLIMHPFSTSQVFSIIPANESTHTCNLLIVSNNYLPTIKRLLLDNDELNYLIVKRQNQLDAEFINSLTNVDLLIVPASQTLNTLNYFANNDYTFHRCFIEDTAALSTIAREVPSIRSEFTWLLTEHWTKLAWPDLDFNDLENVLERTINTLMPNAPKTMRDYIQFEKAFSPIIGTRSLLYKYLVFHPLITNLIVLSEPSSIAESMNIGPETKTIIKYGYDEPLQIVHSMLSTTVSEQLARNETLNVINSIGAQIMAPDLWLNEKHAYIRDETDEESCPICYEKPSYPAVTECCRKLFCISCLVNSCKAQQSCICPMCRGRLLGNRLLVVAEIPKKPEYLYPNKLNALINVLGQNQNKSTLLYFPYEPRLGRLKAKAKKMNISLEILTGGRYDSQKKLEKFNTNGGILVVTDIKQLHGYQLPSIAVLILYPDDVPQTIQRSLRVHVYGLARPLEVVVFDEDAALVGTPLTVGSRPGTARAASGGINISLGDSSVTTSHT